MSRPIVSSLLVALAAFGVALPLAGNTPATAPASYPRPSLAPISWELQFKHGMLERVYVDVEGKSTPFWFMRYTVINNSGKDILFTPAFEIVSDTGQVIQGFSDVPNVVFDRIKEMYKNNLLQSPTNVFGKLLQGEDNARDGVCIFPALDPNGRDFKLFVTGLSGETVEVKNPVNGKPVILQKALELDFKLPGQAIGGPPAVQLVDRKWVMKEEIKLAERKAANP